VNPPDLPPPEPEDQPRPLTGRREELLEVFAAFFQSGSQDPLATAFQRHLDASHITEAQRQAGLNAERDSRHRTEERWLEFAAFVIVLAFVAFLIKELAHSNPGLLLDLFKILMGALGGSGLTVLYMLRRKRNGEG
jgi:hypothetical protein